MLPANLHTFQVAPMSTARDQLDAALRAEIEVPPPAPPPPRPWIPLGLPVVGVLALVVLRFLARPKAPAGPPRPGTRPAAPPPGRAAARRGIGPSRPVPVPPAVADALERIRRREAAAAGRGTPEGGAGPAPGSGGTDHLDVRVG